MCTRPVEYSIPYGFNNFQFEAFPKDSTLVKLSFDALELIHPSIIH